MNENKIEKPIEQALEAQASIGSSYHKHDSYFSKGRGDQNHGGTGRGGRGGIYNKSNVECYNCHKHGHYANECKSKGDNHASNCAQEDSNHEQEEDGVTLEALAVQPEAPAVQPEVVIQHEVATPIATMMERPRMQQRQPVHL